jgi:hypothetical protein
MNGLFGSGLEEGSTKSKLCSISGMTQRASFIRFGPTTAISTSFDNRHRRPIRPGTWSHFAGQDEILRHGKISGCGRSTSAIHRA